LQNGCQKLRINLVGHVCVFVGCVCCTPTGNHTGQPPANFAQAPSGAGCARLATLAFAPPPPEGALRSRRTQLQNKLYTALPDLLGDTRKATRSFQKSKKTASSASFSQAGG
jgi:hypothetical protein